MDDLATEAARVRRERWGFLCGSIMALGASLSFAAARVGILGGLGAVDLIFAPMSWLARSCCRCCCATACATSPA